MKRIFTIIAIMVIIVAIPVIWYVSQKKGSADNSVNKKVDNEVHQQEVINNPVQENNNEKELDKVGWLQVNGSTIQNEKGEKIQLRGISSHGIAWFSDLITYENLEYLKKEWNINVFRIAMYTDPNASGYISNPELNKQKVNDIVEMAKSLDMYVIIDWHILYDNNPQIYQGQAKEFFDEMSKKYADTPNVIYEICNEPNGNDVKWDYNIKPYAEDIVGTIRANSPKSLVIVGTADWSKNVNEAADNPINDSNVVYTCHFYAGSHGKELQDKIDYCISKNIPVFVSECGITDASGAGQIYEKEFRDWINYLNERNISWLFWSLSNKDEASSIFKPDYNPNDNEDQDRNNYLSETGKIVKSILSTY